VFAALAGVLVWWLPETKGVVLVAAQRAPEEPRGTARAQASPSASASEPPP
jgi:hypothetical protein